MEKLYENKRKSLFKLELKIINSLLVLLNKIINLKN